jgi:hypothetical protein
MREVGSGFPHSEIFGSKLVRSSPKLIAAYHVLHRLSAPRHPPNALKALDRSHDRYPPLGRVVPSARTRQWISSERPVASNMPGSHAVRHGMLGCHRPKAMPNMFPLHNVKQIAHPLSAGRKLIHSRRPGFFFSSGAVAQAIIRQHSPKNGGARRDRTDDLMLAKHALSQLSYGPF